MLWLEGIGSSSCPRFFLPLSSDSLGLLYVPIPHSLPIRSESANICWFPFWPGFVTSGLTYITIPLVTVILWRPVNSNTRDSRNSLFLFSQWRPRNTQKQKRACELNYHDQKIRWTLECEIRKQRTAVSTLLDLISSAYRDLLSWRSNQWPQNVERKLYQRIISSHRTQVMPNQPVMVIARPINLNVSCKLHRYSLLRIRSLPGPRLPRIGNTHFL